MSTVSKILESNDKIELFKQLWTSLDVQSIPALIYVAYTSQNEEEKDSACAILMKFFLSHNENEMPTTAPIISFPVVAGKESKQKRTFIRVPKKQVISQKSIAYAFHLFASQCHTFPTDVLVDSLDVLKKFFKINGFPLPPRILLDMLTFAPLLFDVDNRKEAYELVALIKKEAENKCYVEVIVAINSLLTLFPIED